MKKTENENGYTVMVDDNFHFMDEDERAERHFRNGWVTGHLVRCEKEEA